jgi:hypothetical protein
MSKTVFLDVECYRNYFLICFKSDDKLRTYELHNDSKLNVDEIKTIMGKYLTIGFNSLNYDLPMISYALSGACNANLKKLSDELVLSEKKSWEIVNDYGVKKYSKWNHIDLFEPSPAVMISLKMYGARMHTKKLQDLPIEPDELIKDCERDIIKQYCINDIEITADLYQNIKDRIDLRQIMNDTQKGGDGYAIDFRSKSDAQIAEAIFRKSLGINKRVDNKIDTKHPYTYKAPNYIKFIDGNLNRLKDKLEEVSFYVNNKGQVELNKEVPSKVTIGRSTYTIGIGGLHSNEKNRATVKADNEFLTDIDVVSYYPTIIMNNGYYPEALGERFLHHYKHFYDERIKAKQNGDRNKSESYKIILNGSFGKFGSIYSCLYSPSLLLHTTITGQLTLLMLIELIEDLGFSIISANTDGLTIKGDMIKCAQLQWLITKWQDETGYKVEGINYKAIYHESVNTYIGIKEDGSLKTKGIYADNGLSKHPTMKVCIRAVIDYLTKGISVEDSIYNASNQLTDFISIRKVKGGGVYKGEYLGKVVRWYYAIDGDAIRYKSNGNMVALTEGCKPLMEIPKSEITDIDYNKYIEISNQMLRNLGVIK